MSRPKCSRNHNLDPITRFGCRSGVPHYVGRAEGSNAFLEVARTPPSVQAAFTLRHHICRCSIHTEISTCVSQLVKFFDGVKTSFSAPETSYNSQLYSVYTVCTAVSILTAYTRLQGSTETTTGGDCNDRLCMNSEHANARAMTDIM